MNAKEKLDKLYEEGKRVFSHSKLSTFNNCEFEYYNSYVLKNRGIDNIYTLTGSLLHDNIEELYAGNSDINKFINNYHDKMIELELVGVKFPSESIEKSWRADIEHFLNNFKKIESKMLLEKLFVFEVIDGIWVQGYIDSIMPSEKGKPYVNVYDWKTSSKFSGKKLKDAGRQLLMYKLGIEDNTDLKVDKIMWFMFKYLYVCHTQKNGKVKKKMCNRGKWVKEMHKALEKDLHKLNIDEFELEMILDKAVEDNSIDSLPQEIKDKYWLEDCVVEYDITEENLQELREHVKNTIAAIDSKDPTNKEDWKPVEIDKSTSFYCGVLCGHRKTCEFYKAYLDKNADKFEKKDKGIDLDNLFG